MAYLVLNALLFSGFCLTCVSAILYANGGPIHKNSLKQIPNRISPARRPGFDQNTIDNSITDRSFNFPTQRLSFQWPMQFLNLFQNYGYGNQQIQTPYALGSKQFQYSVKQQDRKSRQAYGQAPIDSGFLRPLTPEIEVDSEFIRPDGGAQAGNPEETPELVDEKKFRIPDIAGIAEITLCSENTIEGRKECHRNCKGVVSCIPHGCFCSVENADKQVDSSESRAVRINPITKALFEFPRVSPLHLCGENTLEGSQSCRNTCAEKGDIIACVTDLCYCNLRKSTKSILESTKEDRAATHPTTTYEAKYPLNEVMSKWECAIGKDDNTKVFAHEKCIRECFAMKAYNQHGGVILTCDPSKGMCKCISFKQLTNIEIKMELETKAETRNKNTQEQTTVPPVPCYGYACLIQAQIDMKKPGDAVSQRRADNFAFCGPNSELGFTKCRDLCTYEKKGVVRCAGHSCYCHFGGIPFFTDGKTGDMQNRRRPINPHSTKQSGSCRGLQCIDQLENSADIPDSFRICGLNNDEGFKKCQGECTEGSKGYIKCAGNTCYCERSGSGAFIGDIYTPGVGYNRQESQADLMAAPFRSRWVFCGKDAEACQSMCQFIGDVSCGRLGCYCDSGL